MEGGSPGRGCEILCEAEAVCLFSLWGLLTVGEGTATGTAVLCTEDPSIVDKGGWRVAEGWREKWRGMPWPDGGALIPCLPIVALAGPVQGGRWGVGAVPHPVSHSTNDWTAMCEVSW